MKMKKKNWDVYLEALSLNFIILFFNKENKSFRKLGAKDKTYFCLGDAVGGRGGEFLLIVIEKML